MAIGKLFHIIHMTGDLPSLEAWYDDVFSVRRGFLDHHARVPFRWTTSDIASGG